MSVLAPRCLFCHGRHLGELRCWRGRYVATVLRLVLDGYGDTCCHCGEPGATTVEHVRPRSYCGTDDLSNLRPAHLACNQKRGRRPMAGYGQRTPTTTRSERW